MKNDRLNMFASIFDAMQSAVALSSEKLPQNLKNDTTIRIDECLDKIKEFEEQGVFLQKNNWDLLFDEIFNNMLQYKDCKAVVLKKTIDEVLCRLYVDDSCPKLKIILSSYGEVRRFELWNIWDDNDISFKDYDYLRYLYRCNSLILEFLERLEGIFSYFEGGCFTFYSEDKGSWIPIKGLWEKQNSVVCIPQKIVENEAKEVESKKEQSTKKKRGRPKEMLYDRFLCNDKEQMLQCLHSLINGRKGRDVALIITACIKEGIMTKPTFKQVSDEFGDIGNVSGYNKYMRERPFTEVEINAIIDKLKRK